MTMPIRKVCDDITDLPSLQAVRDLVTDDHHLVLKIEGPEFDVSSVIDHFAPSLPDYTVFDSGGAVTIKKVIPAEDVLINAIAIVAAATRFRLKAEDLMECLSTKLGLPLDVFFGLDYRPLLRRGWFRNGQSGKLDRVWTYVLYPSYGPHLDGHGTIPSDQSVSSEGTLSWPNAVANDATPPGRSSGGERSGISSGAGSRSATSAVARD